MTAAPWRIREDDGPLVAAAVHAGHDMRPEVADAIAIPESVRLREEDPHTDAWTTVADTGLVAHRSRFEFDLNRTREEAVYLAPDDAFGLQVWRSRPDPEIVARSRRLHDAFYATAERVLDRTRRRWGSFVVYDLHAYNHRRGGPNAPAGDRAFNPDVNVGTGSVDRRRWGPVVERFVESMREHDFNGLHLDVRENVRFRGREFARWVHETFPSTGCCLAIDVKKFFMDEHTGELHEDQWKELLLALESTVGPVLEELGR